MTDEQRITIHVDPSPHAPAEARAALRAALGSIFAFDAEIVVSELVANAVEHARGPVTVEALWRSSRLRIEVSSLAGSSTPQVRHPTPLEPTGRGLLIVDGLASAWGHHDGDGRRLVWAEVVTRTG